MLEELKQNLPFEAGHTEGGQTYPNKEVILEVLAKAADDHKFLARLAENPYKVLQEYALTQEERAALAKGDIQKIESWVGSLDERLKTWLKVRSSQYKW